MKTTILSILAVAALGLSTPAFSDVGEDPGSGGSDMGSSDRTGHEMMRGYPKADGWSDAQLAKKRHRLQAGDDISDETVDAIQAKHPMHHNILRDKH